MYATVKTLDGDRDRDVGGVTTCAAARVEVIARVLYRLRALVLYNTFGRNSAVPMHAAYYFLAQTYAPQQVRAVTANVTA